MGIKGDIFLLVFFAFSCRYDSNDILLNMTDEPIRSAEANARMWCRLEDVSRQVDWSVNGKMGKLSKEDWKDIFSAELGKEQRIAQGLSGGFVLLGMRTSKLKKREMMDLILIIEAFGAERGVTWSDPQVVPVGAYANS